MPGGAVQQQPVGVLLDALERLDARPRCRASRSAQRPGPAVERPRSWPGSGATSGASRPPSWPASRATSRISSVRGVVLEGEHHDRAARCGRRCGPPGAPRWSCPGPAGRRAAPARRSGAAGRASGRARSNPVGQTARRRVRAGRGRACSACSRTSLRGSSGQIHADHWSTAARAGWAESRETLERAVRRQTVGAGPVPGFGAAGAPSRRLAARNQRPPVVGVPDSASGRQSTEGPATAGGLRR